MSQSNYPAVAVFPDLQAVIRTPSGIEYRGKLRMHPSTKEDGEYWYEGFVAAQDKEHVLADTVLNDRFRKHAARPAHFHPQSNAEPLHIKLNRIPKDQRNSKNNDTLIGELWTHEGLWTVIVSPSKSPKLILAGSVVPSRQELGYSESLIARYQHSGGDQPKSGTTPS